MHSVRDPVHVANETPSLSSMQEGAARRKTLPNELFTFQTFSTHEANLLNKVDNMCCVNNVDG